MTDSLLADKDLWAVLEPLLPARPPQRIGRPRVSDRVAFRAIVFILMSGVPWRMVPKEIGCSGVTAWRRLRDWHTAGVWERLHRKLLRRLNAIGRIDWSRGVVDASHIRALRGGVLTGPSPVDRARLGSKHHLIVDGGGVPLLATLTGGNRNDVTQLLPRALRGRDRAAGRAVSSRSRFSSRASTRCARRVEPAHRGLDSTQRPGPRRRPPRLLPKKTLQNRIFITV